MVKKLLLSLLLLGGDIQLNPAPNMRYPCGVCNKLAKRNQKGIQCDNCDLWYHTKCCSVSDKMYHILASSPCTQIRCGLWTTQFFSLKHHLIFSIPYSLLQEFISLQQSTFTELSKITPKRKRRSNKNNFKLNFFKFQL